MKREQADQLMKEAEDFIGRRKPVIATSQLGLPSTMEECKFDGITLREVKGEFFPMARMTSIQTQDLVLHEDLRSTIEYLRRQTD